MKTFKVEKQKPLIFYIKQSACKQMIYGLLCDLSH